MTTMGYPIQNEGEHIWLRQSVMLTVDGQTRTLEMAVPVRPGATADEIESLLDEADAGMRRLSRHLDSQIASLSNTVALPDDYAFSANHSTQATPPAPAASTPTAPAATHRLPTPPLAAGVEELDLPAAVEHSRPATKAPVHSAMPPVTPAASAVTAPASATPTPTPRTPAPTPTAAPSTAATDLTPLTVKDFIAAAQTELNLTPKQAMDQLNVKSLAGLNLREALEVLRRQALRGGEPTGSAPQPAATRPSTPPASTSATTAMPRYFEEEDSEFDLRFQEANDDLLEDPLPEDEEEFDDEDMNATGVASYGADTSDDDDPFDLEDVPDFGLPPVTTPLAPTSAPQRRTPPAATPRSRSAEMPETPAPTHSDPRTRALQIIGQMRGTSSGGASTSQQRTAYQNIIIRELGEPEAKALVQGLWRISAERLGAEQFDVLLSWGKRDTFAEEATLVLAALRAERARNAQAATTPTTPTTANRPTRPAPADAAPTAAPARNNSRPTAPRSRQSARSSASEDE